MRIRQYIKTVWRLARRRYGALRLRAVVVAFPALFFFCGLLVFINQEMADREFRAELFEQTITTSRLIGVLAEQKLRDNQLTEVDDEFRSTLMQFAKSAHIEHGVIYDVHQGMSLEFDAGQTSFYANDIWPCVGEVLETQKHATRGDDEQLSVAVPMVVNNEFRGAVSVIQTKEFYAYKRTESLLRAALIAGVFCLVVVPAVLFFLSRLLKPIRTLTRAARQLQLHGTTSGIEIKGRHDEIGSLATTFDKMAKTIAQKSAEQKRLANVDPVTGLANRSRFEAIGTLASERLAVDGKGWSFLFVDLDKFKRVNDTLGHEFGDILLQNVAKLIEDTCSDYGYRVVGALEGNDVFDSNRPLAFVARFGGDEFVLALRAACEGEAAPGELAQAIIARIKEPVLLSNHTIEVGISIGISLMPENGTSAPLLLRHADLAMYEAKALGGNSCRFYEEEMSHKVLDRMVIEMELRRAIGQGEIVPYFMPKVRLNDGAICGFEALARWRHPRKGMIAPDHFVPLAEETGIISEIDRIVLRKAVKKASTWWKQGFELPVAVNVAASHVERPDFVEFVERVLKESGLPGHLLELEFTETAAMNNAADVIAKVTSLKALGVRFAIDDFGTGYSNLAQLRRLPVDVLKIDRSLIRDIGATTDATLLVETIVAMTKQMKLDIVVEGVETADQADILGALGCTFAQGYLYGAPRPEKDALKLVDRLNAVEPAPRLVANG